MSVVSVILPVYNVESYLDQCLTSLTHQALHDIEIIAVDDGSTDRSGRILDDWASRESRLIVIHQANVGAGPARNAGIARAHGKYLYFCDPDDWVEKGIFVRSVKAAECHQADVVVFGYQGWFEGARRPQAKRLHPDLLSAGVAFAPDTLRSRIFTLIHPSPWNKLFRRQFILDAGLRYQNLPRSNDVFFTCCTVILARTIVTVDRQLYNHRIGREGSLQTTRDVNPFTFYDAKFAVRDRLVEHGVFSVYCDALYLSLAREAFKNLFTYKELETFREGYARLHALFSRALAEGVDEQAFMSDDLLSVYYPTVRQLSDPFAFLHAYLQLRKGANGVRPPRSLARRILRRLKGMVVRLANAM